MSKKEQNSHCYPRDVIKILNVSDSTLRKWSSILGKNGYEFDIKGCTRIFTNQDIIMLRKIQFLVTEMKFTIVEAVKSIIGEYGTRNSTYYTTIQETKVIRRKRCMTCGEIKDISVFVTKHPTIPGACLECRIKNRKIRKQLYLEEKNRRGTGIDIYRKEYRNRLKEHGIVLGHERKEIEKCLPSFSKKEKKIFIEQNEKTCALTKVVGNVTIEHFIPLAWGHGGTCFGNVYLLDKALNSSKQDKNPFVWIEELRMEIEVNFNHWNKLIEKLAHQNGLTEDKFKDFVYWCENNKRTVEEIRVDKRKSIEIWKATLAV